MKALCKLSPKSNDLGLIDMPIPKVLPDEVLIKSPGCGVCLGDIYIWRSDLMSHQIQKYPFALGNENYGVIAEVGRNVKKWKAGDRVVAEHFIGCGNCLWCRTGQPNLCKHRKNYGRSGFRTGGTMCEYFPAPSTYLHKIPDNVSGVEASLSEKLATVVQGCIINGRGINPGDNVVIIGPGPIGQISSQMARLSGALNIVVLGLSRDIFRLEIAKKLSATRTINVEQENSVEIVKDLTGGVMADVVILCAVVNSSAVANAINLVRRGGKIMSIGLGGPPTVDIPFSTWTMKETVLTGTMAHSWWAWEYSLRMMATKRAKFDQIITLKLPFEQWLEAFLKQEQREDPFIQGLLYWKHMDWQMSPK